MRRAHDSSSVSNNSPSPGRPHVPHVGASPHGHPEHADSEHTHGQQYTLHPAVDPDWGGSRTDHDDVQGGSGGSVEAGAVLEPFGTRLGCASHKSRYSCTFGVN